MANYGGMDVSETKRLKRLEDEKARLKRLLADAMLDNAALTDLLGQVVAMAAKRQAVAHRPFNKMRMAGRSASCAAGNFPGMLQKLLDGFTFCN
jgi:hypothetical protein